MTMSNMRREITAIEVVCVDVIWKRWSYSTDTLWPWTGETKHNTRGDFAPWRYKYEQNWDLLTDCKLVHRKTNATILTKILEYRPAILSVLIFYELRLSSSSSSGQFLEDSFGYGKPIQEQVFRRLLRNRLFFHLPAGKKKLIFK
jgi:hypothetical protein